MSRAGSRNRDDGAVEAVFEGEPEAVEAHGRVLPPRARRAPQVERARGDRRGARGPHRLSRSAERFGTLRAPRARRPAAHDRGRARAEPLAARSSTPRSPSRCCWSAPAGCAPRRGRGLPPAGVGAASPRRRRRRHSSRRGGEDVVVHVAGAVREPGVYRLPAGSRVDRRGRARRRRRRRRRSDAINLAAELADGQQVVVPPSARAAARSPAPAAAEDGPISLGTATVEQLDTIEGIGPVTARDIIEFRDQHGGLSSVDQLDQISGIGPGDDGGAARGSSRERPAGGTSRLAGLVAGPAAARRTPAARRAGRRRGRLPPWSRLAAARARSALRAPRGRVGPPASWLDRRLGLVAAFARRWRRAAARASRRSTRGAPDAAEPVREVEVARLRRRACPARRTASVAGPGRDARRASSLVVGPGAGRRARGRRGGRAPRGPSRAARAVAARLLGDRGHPRSCSAPRDRADRRGAGAGSQGRSTRPRPRRGGARRHGVPEAAASLARLRARPGRPDRPATREDFQRSGLAHLLAVSGQNVILLALLAVAGARRCSARPARPAARRCSCSDRASTCRSPAPGRRSSAPA